MISTSNNAKRSSFFGNYRDSKSSNDKLHRVSIGNSYKKKHKNEPDSLSVNASIKTETLFGAPLGLATQTSGKTSVFPYSESHSVSLTVPSVVKNCVDFLTDNNCFSKEGIFRIGGNLKRIKSLQGALNDDPNLAFDQLDYFKSLNVYDVSTLLKRYLNSLPDSIIPTDIGKDIKAELENIIYKDLVIFTQYAQEQVSLKIEHDAPADADAPVDTDYDSAMKTANSSEEDISDDTKKNKVLIVDVNLESLESPTSNQNLDSNSQVVSEISGNTQHRKPSGNGENTTLLKPLSGSRPVPPPYYRKHSLMSVLSNDSALTDGKSFSSAPRQSLTNTENRKMPLSVEKAIESLLDFLVPIICNDLENSNASLLIFMLRFLSLLSSNFEMTKMNSFNLSKIFQTSFFLNVQLSGNIDLLQNNMLNKTHSNASGANPNRLSVSMNGNQAYSANNSSKLQPSFTRNSIISSNSAISGPNATSDNATASSVNFNNLSIPGSHIHDNFSLESFTSINVDYNIHQLMLKILIDNYELLLEKLFEYIEEESEVKNKLFTTHEGSENVDLDDSQTDEIDQTLVVESIKPQEIKVSKNNHSFMSFGSPISEKSHGMVKSPSHDNKFESNPSVPSKKAASKSEIPKESEEDSVPPNEHKKQKSVNKNKKLVSIIHFLRGKSKKDKLKKETVPGSKTDLPLDEESKQQQFTNSITPIVTPHRSPAKSTVNSEVQVPTVVVEKPSKVEDHKESLQGEVALESPAIVTSSALKELPIEEEQARKGEPSIKGENEGEAPKEVTFKEINGKAEHEEDISDAEAHNIEELNEEKNEDTSEGVDGLKIAEGKDGEPQIEKESSEPKVKEDVSVKSETDIVAQSSSQEGSPAQETFKLSKGLSGPSKSENSETTDSLIKSNSSNANLLEPSLPSDSNTTTSTTPNHSNSNIDVKHQIHQSNFESENSKVVEQKVAVLDLEQPPSMMKSVSPIDTISSPVGLKTPISETISEETGKAPSKTKSKSTHSLRNSSTDPALGAKLKRKSSLISLFFDKSEKKGQTKEKQLKNKHKPSRNSLYEVNEVSEVNPTEKVNVPESQPAEKVSDEPFVQPNRKSHRFLFFKRS